MKSLTYIGPAASVEVPLPPDHVAFVVVAKGESHEFAPDHWRSLLKQKDNWIATSDDEKIEEALDDVPPVAEDDEEPAAGDDSPAENGGE
jgi:hypothetical protein